MATYIIDSTGRQGEVFSILLKHGFKDSVDDPSDVSYLIKSYANYPYVYFTLTKNRKFSGYKGSDWKTYGDYVLYGLEDLDKILSSIAPKKKEYIAGM